VVDMIVFVGIEVAMETPSCKTFEVPFTAKVSVLSQLKGLSQKSSIHLQGPGMEYCFACNGSSLHKL